MAETYLFLHDSDFLSPMTYFVCYTRRLKLVIVHPSLSNKTTTTTDNPLANVVRE
jgi:hypothetical protein